MKKTFHWSSAVPKRFKRNINEELHQAMRTSSDIKVGKDRMFHIRITKCDRRITKCDRFRYYEVRQSWITNYDRFWITKCDKNLKKLDYKVRWDYKPRRITK